VEKEKPENPKERIKENKKFSILFAIFYIWKAFHTNITIFDSMTMVW
jgi:hypothetical protein